RGARRAWDAVHAQRRAGESHRRLRQGDQAGTRVVRENQAGAETGLRARRPRAGDERRHDRCHFAKHSDRLEPGRAEGNSVVRGPLIPAQGGTPAMKMWKKILRRLRERERALQRLDRLTADLHAARSFEEAYGVIAHFAPLLLPGVGGALYMRDNGTYQR